MRIYEFCQQCSTPKQLVLVILFVALLATGLFVAGTRPAVAHLGPTQTVAHWDYGQSCVTYIKGTDEIEDLVKQTLPNEWIGSWPYEALYAGAELIRTNAVYFDSYPEGDYGLCNQTGQFFHWRDSRMMYEPGSNYWKTDNATDWTHPYGWKSNNNLIFYEFNSCYQNKTKERADAGQTHTQMIQDHYNSDAQACGLPGHTNNSHVSIN